MSVFSCDNCLREFSRKDYLKKHLGRKNPCKKNEFLEKSKSLVSLSKSKSKSKVSLKIDEISEKKNGYNCDYCDKYYKHKQSRYKHMKKCKKKDLYIKNNSQNITNITNTNNNNSNNTINITNNINIRPFGKENLESIKKKDIIEILNKSYLSFPKALKRIHYDIPENRNFYQPNKNKKYIRYYNGENWIYENEKKFNSDLSYNQMYIIEKWYSTLKDRLNETRKEIISRMFDDYDNGRLDNDVENHCKNYIYSYSSEIKNYMDEQIKKLK